MKNIVYICLIFISSCATKEEAPLSAIKEEMHLIEATEVLSLQPKKPISLPGELYPWNRVSIHSKVKGFVKDLKVDRGSKVKKGQILAQLDAPEVITQFDQAKGQLAAAEASLHQAKARLNASVLNFQRLQKANNTKGAVAINELDQAEAKMLADSAAMVNAEGNLSAAKSHHRTQEELVNYLTITAPFDGIIIERNISPGELIGGADAFGKPIFVLEDNSKLRLTLAIPEMYVNSIHSKSDVVFTINALPGQLFNAKFGRSSESILDKNRVMMTEFDVNNTSNELKAGMYAEVTLPVIRRTATLFVQKSAVVNSSEKVFVIKSENGKAKWIPVKKGISLDTLTEVFGNINAGDKVVKEGSEEIREGQMINLQ